MSPVRSSNGTRDTPSAWSAAAALLQQAAAFARELGCSAWDFAVEIGELRSAGLTNNDVRRLVLQGLVEHRVECTKHTGRVRRAFRKTKSLTFQPTSCFVLTGAGAQAYAGLGASHAAAGTLVSGHSTDAAAAPAGPISPYWDRVSRTLWFGSQVVKQFKVPARNQELVLSAFAEEGWPPYIDDPLPPALGIDPKRRLHDTINSLNQCQQCRRIRFHGNGNGRAVHWERVG